jgi:hypothetical protein
VKGPGGCPGAFRFDLVFYLVLQEF